MNQKFNDVRLSRWARFTQFISPFSQSAADDAGGPKEVLFTGSFILLLASCLLMITGIGIFYLFPLFVLDRGGSRADIGILMGLMSLAAVLGRPWISSLVDRIGRKRSITVGCLILAVVSLSHLFFDGAIENTFPVLAILRLFFGAATALVIIASLTMAADLASGPRLNEGLGIFGIMPMLGIAIGPMVGENLVNCGALMPCIWGQLLPLSYAW